jgi:hypothetical protein
MADELGMAGDGLSVDPLGVGVLQHRLRTANTKPATRKKKS